MNAKEAPGPAADRPLAEDRLRQWMASDKTDTNQLVSGAELEKVLIQAAFDERSLDWLEFAAHSGLHAERLQSRRRRRWRRGAIGAALAAAVTAVVAVHSSSERDLALREKELVDGRCRELEVARTSAETARNQAVGEAGRAREELATRQRTLQEATDEAERARDEARRDAEAVRQRSRERAAAANAYALLGAPMPAALVYDPSATPGGPLRQPRDASTSTERPVDSQAPPAWQAIDWMRCLPDAEREPLVRLLLTAFPLRIPLPEELRVHRLLQVAFGPSEEILVLDNSPRLVFMPSQEAERRASWRFVSLAGSSESQLVVSENGNRAVLCDAAGRVRTWTTGAAAAGEDGVVLAQAGTAIRVAVSADGSLVASIANGRVVVLRLSDATPLTLLDCEGPGGRSTPINPKEARFSANGKWLAVAYQNQAVLYDLGGNQAHAVLAEGQPPSSLSISADSRWLAVARRASDGSESVFVRALAAIGSSVDPPPAYSLDVAARQVFFVGANTLVARTDDAILAFVLQPGLRPSWQAGARRAAEPQAVVRADGLGEAAKRRITRILPRPAHDSQILCCFDDGALELWDMANNRSESMPRVHRSEVRSVAFSRDGRRFLSIESGEPTIVRSWNLEPSAAAVQFFVADPEALIGGMR